MVFYYYKCRPKNHPFPVIAWLIMLFQGQLPWKKDSTSHRALGYVCQSGKMKGMMMVIDSTGKDGVKVQLLESFEKSYKIVSFTTIDLKIDCTKFFHWTRNHDEIGYDYLQIIGLLAKQLFGFISFNSTLFNFKNAFFFFSNLFDTSSFILLFSPSFLI